MNIHVNLRYTFPRMVAGVLLVLTALVLAYPFTYTQALTIALAALVLVADMQDVSLSRSG